MIAGEKVVYSNGIEEHSVGSELLQFFNFVKWCVDEKQGDESQETLMLNSGKKPDITFSKQCYYPAYKSSFNVLKQQWWKAIFETERINNELTSSMSQQRLSHLSLMSIYSEILRKQNFTSCYTNLLAKKHVKYYYSLSV